MAYQFVHLETYSRKGRDGRSVDFILAEAERRPDGSGHITAPAEPELVFGVDVGTVRHLHDERAASSKATMANGKQRAIRKDQNTLVTVVASHPATMELVRADAALAHQVREWESRTVEWLRDQYGDQLVSVVRHVDESHPHVHAFILPDGDDMRAACLHPGQKAKMELAAAGPGAGEDAKAANRRGDRAYRAALRVWQDSYWKQVGLPCGLTRLGPGRRRLTREEWKAERTQSQAVRAAQERIAALRTDGHAYINTTRAQADVIKREAQAEAARLHAHAVQKQKHAARLHDTATARLATARIILRDARDEGHHILGLARTKAARLRSLGARLRSFWDGLRKAEIENRLRQSFASKIAIERKRADDARREATEERCRRRDADLARERAILAVHTVGRERDAARRELATLRPNTSQLESTYGARP